jgi:large subunit ribosomal protein L23
MKIYPLSTEKSINLISKSNTIVFMVEENATKKDIKDYIEKEFNVKVEKVNVTNTFKGKKAYVKLSKEYSALDLASRLKVL